MQFIDMLILYPHFVLLDRIEIFDYYYYQLKIIQFSVEQKHEQNY